MNQAAAAVVSHKFKGWVADKRQRLRLGTKHRRSQSMSEALEARNARTTKLTAPLSGIL